MHFSRYPRVKLAHLPTALEPMEQLSKALGAGKAGPQLWIKRDDCTGLAGGGNKTRKLEFLMADAIAHKATAVITQGAVQSNHARQTAAAACKLGLSCHLLFEERTGSKDVDYNYNGNVMLDQLFGARLSRFPAGTDMNAAMETLAAQLADAGDTPYVIPGGGSNAVGALGYANCAAELLYQANQASLKIDQVVHATGSAGTQAGLVAGFKASGSGIPVLGFGVRAPQEVQEANVYDLARRTVDHLGLGDIVRADDVRADCNYVGDGYGIPTEQTMEAIELFARTEGILLDPVYSGKGAAGMIDYVRNGRFESTDTIVFIHTGGAQALFGYRDAFSFPDYRA